ncbi:MAG TPA: ComEC/Rec2 family competence protein [Pseudolabrys sp.]|nr:ComEC/Rec2 family competence protein [Pseudolabrys sp.]
MSQPEQPRARARAWGAGIDAARRHTGLFLPGVVGELSGRLRRLLSQWVLAELAPGRLMPWLPVCYGLGIVAYFSAEREPVWWAADGAAMAAAAIAILARRSSFGLALALGVAAVVAGFATATSHTARIAHRVLDYPVASARITGFVESNEERQRSDRIVVRVLSMDAPRLNAVPSRVRVAVRRGAMPPVGSFIDFKAHLSPPLPPLRPGGYDFARDMYFQQIGASGYALGKITITAPPTERGLWLRYASFLANLRDMIDVRMRTVISGDEGAIASALITGRRDAISQPLNDAFYISSLAHVLSISGYHMAVVAGIVFFVIRATLALVPGIAMRHPIKKWAAGAAVIAAAFYLVLSGNEVATQRSFIMIAIVLAGIMFDRPTLTFRTIAVAAFVVLMFAPHAVVHPSFQMSFAATLALIAGYQHGLPWHAAADTPRAARFALWGARELTGLVLASVVAGLATTPYAAYHFHRVAPYGVLANLLAMPVVSALVMPAGIIGVLAIPFGFDAPFWRLMGYGIEWMDAVALWVAGLPGAVGHIRAFGTGPLLLATLGLLLLCLLRTRLRWSGAILVVAATALALTTPLPDVLVASDGQAAAIRTAKGRLAVLSSGRDTFAVKEWLMADADDRPPTDPSLRDDIDCDAVGCIGRLADGRLASVVLNVEAFREDCMRAAVVISAREAPGDCAAKLIDRQTWRGRGATALRWTGVRFEESYAQPPGTDRPWATAPVERRAARSSTLHDATPRPEDLESGD